ncbi:methyltransferase type 11 [Rhodococcoides trifolii]|uniref:Methyltransferase type 11 n=1 Tax=Rhodococcoides trifolii TaxID=908250 RepID=A0A917D1Z8_9NOCA|nr:class I SAM-dependent methyltransferase [Rhodococcus trifolii]GGG07348.1 methyltransferase type 11 [Rhodococcus trifolii]
MAVIKSPNIWNWPEVYEAENRAQDAHDALFTALREVADWAGKDVVDVGCGTGFHLPRFATDARSVLGVEPHQPLLPAATARVRNLPSVSVALGSAERLPLPDESVDVVHARTAYFFGAGCGPGIIEALRVLRPGGVLVVVDLDATASPYGDWMRADLPHYDPVAVERFFDAQGFDLRRVETLWRFDDRRSLREVLSIEFSGKIARRAIDSVPGLSFPVRYRLHTRRKPTGLINLR